MTKINIGSLLITSLFITGIFSGCSKDHLDPSQIGRFRPVPTVNVILDTLGVAEESASAYEGAEDPRPADVVAYEKDYAFSSGDIIRISIFELLQEGAPYVDNYIVSESGNISIPEIGQLQAVGLTESQLADEIRQSLSPGILKNPSVTVSLMSSQSRVFTILGDGVAAPNRYPIPRYDFRLLDALAVAGSARQFNVSYVYIARRLTGQEQLIGESEQDTGLSLHPVEAGDSLNQSDLMQKGYKLPEEINDGEMLEVIEPAIFPSQLVISSAEMVTEKELEELARPEEITSEDGEQQTDVTVSNTIPQSQQDNTRVEWVFKDGKWEPVQVAAEEKKPAQQGGMDVKAPVVPQRQEEQVQYKPPFDKQALPESYGWQDIQSAGVQSRVIRIPKDKLYGGDPRYNIIIKPGDTITVQLDVVGEFYVLGNINNQGVINLTGRPMTLKMAIAAAGGLGPLAWPKKCEVIRRIGEKKEEIVMVDLEKIANGSQPDFFIKPNDVINVGTHGVSRWLASLRNAFRATYGFGFIYDRNFGYRPLSLGNPMRLLENPD
ncbi:MAG: polysaccharide biosynthesis/export family protein [Planctomycetes bacterium]|nr:polysaccharide biosynthesis/export family protein [Planctomycetota bacterium]MBU1517892.1 polysaccharide biosynthesis/export family protein [Planctomycetota bacterium]MBU2458315.1 polysaccharide biosynthesis/export family protein [Planctomycetota bacterium]MBU2596164.1 polysaccharide biosynthesis/export family protein [Planctomycetota bacterium]